MKRNQITPGSPGEPASVLDLQVSDNYECGPVGMSSPLSIDAMDEARFSERENSFLSHAITSLFKGAVVTSDGS